MTFRKTTVRSSDIFRKRPTPTRPSYRSGANASTGTVGTASSLNITIPAGVQNNDWPILSVTIPDGTITMATPSGWTPLGVGPWSGVVGHGNAQPGSQVDGSPGSICYLYTKSVRLTTSDASTTITLTPSGATEVTAVLGVYQNVGQVSIQPICWDATNTESLNNRLMRTPSIVCGPNDLKVGVTSTYSYTSLGANQADLTGAPSSGTVRQVAHSSNGALSYAHAAGLWDSSDTALRYEIATFTTQVHAMNLILTLGPIAGVWNEMDRVPPSISGQGVVSYGTSIGCNVVRAETNTGYTTKRPWPARIANMIGTVAKSMNFCMAGSMVSDQCTAAYGSHSVPTQAVPSGDAFSNTQSPNYISWVGAKGAPGLVMMDPWGNDFLSEVSRGTARQRLSAAIAADALIRLVRASAMKLYNDASIAYGGTWATAASDGYAGGTVNVCTTPGGTITITTTQQSLDLVFIAEDNTANSTVGATYTITVNGSTYTVPVRTFAIDAVQSITTATTPGVTHNQMMQTTGGGGLFGTNYPIYKFCQMTVPIEGMPAGTNTIVITHTGAAASRLVFNGWLQRAITPPYVLINGLCPFPDPTYGSFNPGNTTSGYQDKGRAALAIYQTMSDNIAEMFSDGRVFTMNPKDFPFNLAGNATPGGGGSGDYMSDNVHGLETWHAIYVNKIMQLLNTKIP